MPTARFNRRRTFGVEFELAPVSGGRSAVGTAIREAGFRVVSQWGSVAGWLPKSDASVNGYELSSPRLTGARGLTEVVTVMDILRNMGQGVNRSCGLHVHHSIAGMNIRGVANMARIVHLFWNDIGKWLISPRRRTSHWCVDPVACNYPTRERLESALQDTTRTPPRYSSGDRATNLGRHFLGGAFSYRRHFPTLEFRAHQGTMNPAKVISWMVFTQLLMNRSRANGAIPRRLDISENNGFGAFWETCLGEPSGELEAWTRDYLQERYFHFRASGNEETPRRTRVVRLARQCPIRIERTDRR